MSNQIVLTPPHVGRGFSPASADLKVRPTIAMVIVAIAALAAGCTVGPNYKRPPVTTPDNFRGATVGQEAAAAGTRTPSFADQQWSQVFQDEPLRALIKTALAENFDVRIAASRILQAKAAYRVTRADQFPTVDAQAQGQGQRGTVIAGQTLPTTGSASIGLALSWELDFWGKYRRATEAARAEILATEWGRRAVLTSLVGQVATAYYDLRALDLELEIARRTLSSRQESLKLTQVRESGGATSLADVRQAEQLVHSANGEIIDVQRQIEQQENFISALLGRYPDTIPRGEALTDQAHAPQVPAGLPSALLDRRPDIQQAEQLLVSANAQIGVAKAQYFPQIFLTGAGGVASSSLSSLFTNGTWAAAAGVLQPIFNAGRTRGQVALAKARTEEASLVYQQAIHQAFREVSDALVGYRRSQEFRTTQEQLVASAQDARRLAELRYQGGAASYLEVLDSDTRLFVAELGLVEAQRDELAAYVEIYRALGGGWA
jgi:outer membrane protein, multidrug efflux system